MNSYNIINNKYILLVIVVLVNSIEKCSTLCGNSFSQASAIVTIDGEDDNYVANTCVKNLPIEKFQLLTKTKIIYPGTFSNLFRLETIELNNCGITKVQPGFMENTPAMQTIKIEGNKLESIGQYTFDEIRLRTLDMSTNNISRISDNAFQSSTFEYLCLSNNKLTAINPNCFQNTTIRALSITHNLVTSLDKRTFYGIKGIKSLKLSYNRIRTIHYQTFSSLETLQIVYLPGNLLETIDFDIKGSLINIDISFNKISYLSPDEYTSLWIMSVYPNPFECSCLREFWKFVNRKRLQLWDTKALKQPWKDEYPLCIAKYDNCNRNGQNYVDVQNDYFNIMNYNILGRPKYRKEDDFLDLGIVN